MNVFEQAHVLSDANSIDLRDNMLNTERQVTFVTPCIYFIVHPWLAKLSQKLHALPFSIWSQFKHKLKCVNGELCCYQMTYIKLATFS